MPAGEQQQVVNLSGYRFVTLNHLPVLQADLQQALQATGILGTILLAEEGINVQLAGTAEQVDAAMAVFEADERLAGLWLKRSHSGKVPFSKLKVRVRREIIAFDGGQTRPDPERAPAVDPNTLKQWLDEKRNLILLDTRNRYEVEAGSFDQAVDLGIDTFREFPAALRDALERGELDPDMPVVTFCTGGVRCEKAAPFMRDLGFSEVYQIDGGIINWLEQQGGAHWHGECFVFDDRRLVDAELKPGVLPTIPVPLADQHGNS